jgi:acyl-CoA thioester hydrolase
MRLELPDDLKLVHEMRIPVRWGDLDAIGHLNSAIYFRFLETLRIDWFMSLELEGYGAGSVLANAFCNFIKEIKFPGEVVARLFVTSPGGRSLDTYFTLSMADSPDIVCANGGATIVWLAPQNNRAVPPPDAVRAACM